MPTTHRKLSRKELKQPDEFITLFGQAQEFFVNNLRQVFISAGVVVGVATIAFLVYTYERHRDTVAADHFYAALSALNARNYKEAEDSFAKLADAEPGRSLGRLARFYLGETYLAENDLPRARDALVEFLAEEHDPLFMNMARADLAVVYEQMGDYAKAANAYAQAASVPGPEQVRAELGVARMLAKQGDQAAAIESYRRFLDEHPFAPQRQDVIESLAMLGAPAEPPKPTSGAVMPIVPAPAPAPASAPH
jgi:tetratricopeptide (TPR) repeat protein